MATLLESTDENNLRRVNFIDSPDGTKYNDMIMTRLERKQVELKKLYEYKAAALRRNDLTWLWKNQSKMETLIKEIEELKNYAPTTLKKMLDDKNDKELTNRFYRCMLRISLLADVVNEACEDVRDLFKKELGVKDFSLRKEVEDMRALSAKIANFAIIPNGKAIEDCIVDDGDFVEACIKLADEHLSNKLKL